MNYLFEHAALVVGVITSIGGGVAWYSAFVRKQYAAERDFQHLKRNYETMRDALSALEDDLDKRLDKVDLQQVHMTAMLQNLVSQVCRGGMDSQGWN